MLKISTTTKLSPEETIKQAVEFFNSGYGLEVKEQAPNCASFEGGGGRVDVTACAQEKGTSVGLESQEWDYQVKKFIDNIS